MVVSMEHFVDDDELLMMKCAVILCLLTQVMEWVMGGDGREEYCESFQKTLFLVGEGEKLK